MRRGGRAGWLAMHGQSAMVAYYGGPEVQLYPPPPTHPQASILKTLRHEPHFPMGFECLCVREGGGESPKDVVGGGGGGGHVTQGLLRRTENCDM